VPFVEMRKTKREDYQNQARTLRELKKTRNRTNHDNNYRPISATRPRPEAVAEGIKSSLLPGGIALGPSGSDAVISRP